MRSRSINSATVLLFLILVPMGGVLASESSLQSGFEGSGWLTVVWGDGQAREAGSEPLVFLTDSAGEVTRLILDEKMLRANGGLLRIDRTMVHVQGTLLNSDNSTGESLEVAAMRVLEEATPLGAQGANTIAAAGPAGPQPWVNILCRYKGNPSEPRDLTYFNGLFGSSSPGLDHYWREASYESVNIFGTQAVGWYELPRTRSQYLEDARGLLNALFDDCTSVADSEVDFRDFVGINLMFNDQLDADNQAWGGSHWGDLDGQSGLWYTTWEPPWGYAHQSVLSHEMGHGFGLPHSADAYGMSLPEPNPYRNAWDVMSSSWFNCFGPFDDPVYGCPGQGTIAYHKDLLDWIPQDRRFVATPGTHNIKLEQLSLPTSGDDLIAIIPIDGEETHFYTVEVRRLVGYDEKLAANAVIIHEVDELRWDDVHGWLPPAYIVDPDPDGDGDTTDDSAQWTVGEEFRDAANEISVRVNSRSGSTFNLTIVLDGSSPPTTSGIPADFDGDGDTDISVYRPSIGRWYVLGGDAFNWGLPADIPVPADYDGDGDADGAVYRPSNGRWYIQGGPSFPWGAEGDIPMPCDYDGDGDADPTVFRPSTGRWYIRGGSSSTWGINGDTPVPGDYDGDGDCDLAVFRPTNGRWYVRGQFSQYWGEGGDIPVPGDYDGDGSADLAVFRPSNGRWYIYGEASFPWGLASDIPVPGDYDGDGSYDAAVFRSSEGRWYVMGDPSVNWGTVGDYPLPARDTNGDGDPQD